MAMLDSDKLAFLGEDRFKNMSDEKRERIKGLMLRLAEPTDSHMTTWGVRPRRKGLGAVIQQLRAQGDDETARLLQGLRMQKNTEDIE